MRIKRALARPAIWSGMMAAFIVMMYLLFARLDQKRLWSQEASGWAQTFGALLALVIAVGIPLWDEAKRERRSRAIALILARQVVERLDFLEEIHHRSDREVEAAVSSSQDQSLGMLVAAMERLPVEGLGNQDCIAAFLQLIGVAQNGMSTHFRRLKGDVDRDAAVVSLRRARRQAGICALIIEPSNANRHDV